MSQTLSNLPLSSRSTEIEESITMKVSALAKSMKAAGEDVIGFGTGEPDFDTPEFIKEAAIKAISEGKNKYTAATGLVELKSAIQARLLADHNLSYEPNQIVVSCGAKHSIFNALMALVNPGDEVIVPSPYWVSYPEQIRLNGGVPVVIDCPDTANFKLTADQLRAAITPKTRVLILNSPSNPSGMMYDESELAEIAKVVLEHDIWVISDEIYEKLSYAPHQHYSIASVSEEIKQRTILVNGVSKAYAMTGWRIGYLAATPQVAKVIGNMQSHMTSNPSTQAQWASIAALTGDQGVVDEMKVKFNSRRQLILRLLRAIPGIECVEPQGAFYAFPNVSALYGKQGPDGVITDSVSFCEQLLKAVGVAAVPGAGFGADDYIRLSYATSDELIEAGLKRIHDFVESRLS